MISNYIILSSKPWNSDLVDRLKKQVPKSNWHFISRREDFNLEILRNINPDKIFIPHWSYIIPESIFLSYECIVFHMTDLPYGRGGSPLQNLIVSEKKETKISAIKVVKQLDAGPVYLKADLSLYGTAEEVFIRANNVIFNMIIKMLEEKPIPTEQKGEVTLFKRRTPTMSSIKDLDELETVFNHIRMLDADGYPHAFFETENFKFEFTRASLKADKSILADVRITKK